MRARRKSARRVVCEEDTFLVLSGDTTLPEKADHPIRVMTGVMEAEPRDGGSIVIERGQPPRLLAIIHDLNDEPSLQEPWLRDALTQIPLLARERGFRSLALPLLGTVHGRMGIQESWSLIESALSATPSTLERVWLQINPEVFWQAVSQTD